MDIESQGATINGWHFYWYRLFAEYYTELLEAVETLVENKPDTFHTHPTYKMLNCITETIEERIALDPESPNFVLGNTIGKDNRHWRRAKQGLPNRYRMFFQFSKNPEKSVVIAWINDQSCIRKDGAKTDVYTVFKKMLKNDRVPGTMAELLKEINAA